LITATRLAILLAGSSAGAEPDLAALYRIARQATAEILVDGHHSGSGSFVSATGCVATAAHVIGRPGRTVEILTADGTRRRAEVRAVDLGHDVLLLDTKPRDGGDPFLPLAAGVPSPGESVYLCSSAAFRRGLMQSGTMAREGLTFEFQDHFVEVTQIAALIQEGTSGGAWLNRRGELVGIQSGSVTVKGVPAGIANVGPVTAVRKLLDTGRHAATPTLGLFVDEFWLLAPEQIGRYPPGTEGLVVQALSDEGPAARAGIHKGDVIVAGQDQAVRFRDDFLSGVLSRRPGESVELTLLGPDGTGRRQLAITLGQLEVGWPEAKP
jgi:S1-C subfamily serine protease